MEQKEVAKEGKFLIFTPKERKVYEFLSKRDESGKLPKMLEGAVKVLNDSDNPMRFSQAANTIRGIADELLRRSCSRINHLVPNVDECEFNDMKNCFEAILNKSLEKIADSADKDETSQQVNRTYERLKNLLCYGIRTKKHQLLDLLGLTKNSAMVPQTLQNAAEKLAEIYNYFARVLHSHQEEEPEFEDNWLFFQDFLILATSEFFDIAAEIEPFLEKETISDERSK